MSNTTPHQKLRNDYDHCLNRMMQLFRLGISREHELEANIINAQKGFSKIRDMTNDKKIIEICEYMIDSTQEVLHSKEYKAKD